MSGFKAAQGGCDPQGPMRSGGAKGGNCDPISCTGRFPCDSGAREDTACRPAVARDRSSRAECGVSRDDTGRR